MGSSERVNPSSGVSSVVSRVLSLIWGVVTRRTA